MSAGTVSTKGQVTLPVDLRQKYGIKTHGRVVYVGTKDGILVKAALDISHFKGMGKNKTRMTWDEERDLAAKALDKRMSSFGKD